MTWRRLLVGVAVLALLLVAADAWARVGGGQSFGRRSSGGGGGGGGDGVPIELVYLLVRLVIEYPAIGVPLVLVLIGVMVVRGYVQSPSGTRVQRSHADHRVQGAVRPRAAKVPGLDPLRQRDPGFSVPVLLDFVTLVHRRALEAVGAGTWEPLAPFVADTARERIQGAHQRIGAISEVVSGGVRLVRVEQRNREDHLVVRVESTRLERPKDGDERRVLVDELLTFRRASGVTSPPPERMEALVCPSCGAAIEVGPMGECRNCGTPITRGQLQWQLVWFELQSRTDAIVPEVSLFGGGDEPSAHLPTVQDPRLDATMAALRARHPEFDVASLGGRVRAIYFALQSAWSANRWQDARPFVTDRMFQTLRFWIDRYVKSGLRNQLDDVKLEQATIVKIDLDAHYTAVTLRIWGSMKDAVIDGQRQVVGGNARVARRFSEYWTFLRSAEGPAGSRGDAPGCPSCGAPLDRVDQAGICGYCDSKITSGRFDWVLARIDQPEAYGG